MPCALARQIVFGVFVISGGLLTGCVTLYHPPGPEEAHGAIKIRRTYEKQAGASLNEVVLVDTNQAYRKSRARVLASETLVDVVRVRPGTSEIIFQAGFSHPETKLVTETYTTQVPYSSTETYNCGSSGEYRTCTRSTTRHRSETRTRTVNRLVQVSDGDCKKSVRFDVIDQGIYLLEFTYRDNRVCQLSCYQQLPGVNEGEFIQKACKTRPHPKKLKKAPSSS